MKTLSIGFAALGLLLLAYGAFELVTARVYQARQMRRFASEQRAEPSPADTALPSKSPAMAGEAIPKPWIASWDAGNSSLKGIGNGNRGCRGTRTEAGSWTHTGYVFTWGRGQCGSGWP